MIHLRSFESIEEMKEFRILKTAALDPTLRISQTVELILRVYQVSHDDLAARIPNRKIVFTQSESLYRAR